MKKHFVVFMSPGTFMAESTSLEIESWDIVKAVEMSKNIKERHNATPYGFYFVTRSRKKDELDSKITKKSGTYFLGGKILTLEDIKKRNDPKDKILISNMEINGYEKVIVNNNSWQWTQLLDDDDIVLNIDSELNLIN